MADSDPAEADSIFSERPTEFVVRDAFSLGAAPLALAGACGLLGLTTAGFVLLGLTVFVACFFRNPPREIPGGENSVVAPADGRVIDVAEVEGLRRKQVAAHWHLPVGVQRARQPLPARGSSRRQGSGRAGLLGGLQPEGRGRERALRADARNCCGVRFQVVQITGLIARRIVCHPQVGEWIRRGDRYGLIRFGSRTDVLLPLTAVAKVKARDRVRGGSTIIAEFESTEG